MAYELINTLCESRVFRNKQAISKYSKEEAIEFFYAYLLAVIVLASEKKTSAWAQEYAGRAAAFSNFDHFRISGNDLYVLAYILNTHISNNITRAELVRVLRGIARLSLDKSFLQSYLIRLERTIGMTNTRLRTLRRFASNWAASPQSVRMTQIGILRREIMRKSKMAEILPFLDTVRRGEPGRFGAGAKVAAVAAGGLAGLLLGLRYDPNARRSFLKPVIGEGMENLEEARPTRLFDIVAELEKNPMIEEVISVNYIADGIAAFVRTTDGNAYEFQIRAAPEAQGFEKERGLE